MTSGSTLEGQAKIARWNQASPVGCVTGSSCPIQCSLTDHEIWEYYGRTSEVLAGTRLHLLGVAPDLLVQRRPLRHNAAGLGQLGLLREGVVAQVNGLGAWLGGIPAPGLTPEPLLYPTLVHVDIPGELGSLEKTRPDWALQWLKELPRGQQSDGWLSGTVATGLALSQQAWHQEAKPAPCTLMELAH